MRTLEEIRDELWTWCRARIEHEIPFDGPARYRIGDALREAVAQEYERLYMKLVMRSHADIAGNFDLTLDQLEYNAAAHAVAQERTALREEGTHVCRTSCDPEHKACFWRIPYPRLDAREKSE